MKINPFYTLALGALVTIASCAENKKEEKTEETNTTVAEAPVVKETPNIVEVAVGDDRFSTLVTAVQAADLVGTLSGEGPFTVFAPTNDAFAALPEGTVENLLKPENKEQLTAVLTYHVLSGEFKASAVVDAINNNDGNFTVTTVQGQEISLSLQNGNVILTDSNGDTSKVIITDVAASNGVIHAIDSVVLPATE